MSIPEGFLYFGNGPLKVLPDEKNNADIIGRPLGSKYWGKADGYDGSWSTFEYVIRAGTKLAKDNGLEPEVKTAKIVIKKCNNVRCPFSYVAFQIVEQENIPYWKSFKASNGMKIDSRGDVSFWHEENMLFLRGAEKEGDNNIVVVSCKQYNDIQVAIYEYLAHLNKPKVLYRATFYTIWGRKCLDVYSGDGEMIRGFDVDKKEDAFIPTSAILGPIEKICPKSS